MDRTYSSPVCSIHFFSGLKSAATKLAEATPLKSKVDIIPVKNEANVVIPILCPNFYALPGNDIFLFSKFSVHCLYIPEYYANMFKWISYFSCISPTEMTLNPINATVANLVRNQRMGEKMEVKLAQFYKFTQA